jgi:hypothetical protein
MSDPSTQIPENPFRTWAGLARELTTRFVAELGDVRPLSPYAGDLLGQLAGLATRCEHLASALERTGESDQPTFEAFQRALGQS